MRRLQAAIGMLALVGAALVVSAAPAGAVDVSTEAQLQTNFSDVNVTEITLLNSIDLTCVGGGDLDRDSGNPLTLHGNGFTIRQTCAGERVMELVDADSSGAGALTLEHVTLTGGDATGQGGAVKYGNPGSGGPITILNSTITGNQATGAGGGVQLVGPQTMTIIGSTISGNTAQVCAATAEGNPLLLVNSTITGNTSTGPLGGAVCGDSPAVFVYSTVVGNTAPAGQPANVNVPQFTSFGSVIGNPIGTSINCNNGSNTSAGYNYEAGADTCGFSAATNDVVNGADPQLGALGANGGPTPTMLPALTSPLVDAIPGASCSGGNTLAGFAVTTDQRGLPRPGVAACDIGAVELQPPALRVTFTG